MRRPSNPQTLKALAALALALGATEMRFCYGGNGPTGEPICGDCGGPAELHICESCNGAGLAECWCQGAGEWLICKQDCFARDCFKHN